MVRSCRDSLSCMAGTLWRGVVALPPLQRVGTSSFRLVVVPMPKCRIIDSHQLTSLYLGTSPAPCARRRPPAWDHPAFAFPAPNHSSELSMRLELIKHILGCTYWVRNAMVAPSDAGKSCCLEASEPAFGQSLCSIPFSHPPSSASTPS